MKEKILISLSTFFNFFLKGRFETYIASNIIISPFYLLQYFSTNLTELFLFIILIQFIIIPIAVTNTRLSNVIVYSKLFKIISMSLSDINRYSQYNYNLDKEKIALDFKNEFISGIVNSPYKKMKMTTHKWVVNNIINSNEVKEKYDIFIKPIGKGRLIFDVLILSRKITKSAYIKREMFKVILIKKS